LGEGSKEVRAMLICALKQRVLRVNCVQIATYTGALVPEHHFQKLINLPLKVD